MRLVVDTKIFVGAALKENPLPFLVARWIDQHHASCVGLTQKRRRLSLREGLARMLAAAELWRRPTSAILTAVIGLDPDANMARIPAPNHAIARTHPVLWGHGGCRVGE